VRDRVTTGVKKLDHNIDPYATKEAKFTSSNQTKHKRNFHPLERNFFFSDLPPQSVATKKNVLTNGWP
jgi:hypothetical protein